MTRSDKKWTSIKRLDATPQRLEELKKKGITPIVVPDNEKEHA